MTWGKRSVLPAEGLVADVVGVAIASGVCGVAVARGGKTLIPIDHDPPIGDAPSGIPTFESIEIAATYHEVMIIDPVVGDKVCLTCRGVAVDPDQDVVDAVGGALHRGEKIHHPGGKFLDWALEVAVVIVSARVVTAEQELLVAAVDRPAVGVNDAPDGILRLNDLDRLDVSGVHNLGSTNFLGNGSGAATEQGCPTNLLPIVPKLTAERQKKCDPVLLVTPQISHIAQEQPLQGLPVL